MCKAAIRRTRTEPGATHGLRQPCAVDARVAAVVPAVADLLCLRRPGTLRHQHPQGVVEAPARRRRALDGEAVAPGRVEADPGPPGGDPVVVGVGEAGDLRDSNQICEKLAQTIRVGPTAQKLMSCNANNMERIEKEAAF